MLTVHKRERTMWIHVAYPYVHQLGHVWRGMSNPIIAIIFCDPKAPCYYRRYDCKIEAIINCGHVQNLVG